MPPPSNNRGNGRDGPVNRWHRNVAILAAVGLLYLLMTGIPLQFSPQLALGQRFVTSSWVLDWYGLEAPTLVKSSTGVVHIGGLLFVGKTPLGQLDDLAGAVRTDTATLAAGGKRLVIAHHAAPDLPETMDIASPITRVGQTDDALFLATADGTLAADRSMVNWQPAATIPEAIRWAEVSALDDADAEYYRNAFRGRMLNLERWLQDLHSGRFFGPAGVVLIDALSVLLLVLAGTGLTLWWRYQRRRVGT